MLSPMAFSKMLYQRLMLHQILIRMTPVYKLVLRLILKKKSQDLCGIEPTTITTMV